MTSPAPHLATPEPGGRLRSRRRSPSHPRGLRPPLSPLPLRRPAGEEPLRKRRLAAHAGIRAQPDRLLRPARQRGGGAVRADFDLDSLADGERDALWLRSSGTTCGCSRAPQPECAETFFNSVCTKLLARDYFRNEFLFVRPGVATDYMDSDRRVPQLLPGSGEARRLRATLADNHRLRLACPFVDVERDIPGDPRRVRGAPQARGVCRRARRPDARSSAVQLFLPNKAPTSSPADQWHAAHPDRRAAAARRARPAST